MARSATTTTPVAVAVEPQEDTGTRAQEEVEVGVTEIGQETDGITEEGTVVIGLDGTIMVVMMLAAVVITGSGTALTGIVAIVIVMIGEGGAHAPDRLTVRNHPFCFRCPTPGWLLHRLYLP